MRCIRCPVAYHAGDLCIAAGSVVITPHVIVCSSHSGTKKNGHLGSSVNVGWCFICSRGETCSSLSTEPKSRSSRLGLKLTHSHGCLIYLFIIYLKLKVSLLHVDKVSVVQVIVQCVAAVSQSS